MTQAADTLDSPFQIVNEWLRKVFRSMTSFGVRRALKLLFSEIRVQRIHAASVKKAKAYSEQTNLKLNCGCGQCPKTGWINIDLFLKADLHLDLREKLPFSESSASVIYTEHFFEHLEYPTDALHFLREVFRVLQPNGIFHVGVPDTEEPLKAYAANDHEYFKIARERWHPKWCTTKMHSINYHFRQGDEHKYAYDEETLTQCLRKSGFVSIKRRAFIPELDSAHWANGGTLFMEAQKPPLFVTPKA